MSTLWKASVSLIFVVGISGSGVFYWIHKERSEESRLAKTAINSRLSAERGDAEGQYNLGRMYYHGEGVSQNYGEAARWYRKAADHGFSKAEYDLGYMYNFGQGLLRDDAEAALWYRKAADEGDTRAEINLALLYYYGQGVHQDYLETVNLYRKAADMGDARGEDGLGLMYYEGLGVAQNYTEAAQWYRKAAVQGLAKAQYDLGCLYYNGRGVAENRVEAKRWFYKAAAQGNQDAQRALGTVLTFWRMLELSIQVFGGILLLVGFSLPRKGRGIPQVRIALLAGVLCMFVAGLSWYGYTHYMIRCLLCGLNLFTVLKWVLDAVLIVLLVCILRPREKEANHVAP